MTGVVGVGVGDGAVVGVGVGDGAVVGVGVGDGAVVGVGVFPTAVGVLAGVVVGVAGHVPAEQFTTYNTTPAVVTGCPSDGLTDFTISIGIAGSVPALCTV